MEDLKQEIEELAPVLQRVRDEVAKVLVGQQYMVDGLLLALIADGHVLLEGIPGLAKTTAIKTLAESMDARFARLQFTPDLLPADLTGTQVYRPDSHTFAVHKGPIFSNLVLADEINRAPAKVQSALLEAMQERQVTIGDETFALPSPFLVLATQNPIEHEGTYPLPEAQLDRFMLMVKVGYPDRAEERQILDRITAPRVAEAEPVASLDDVRGARELIGQIHIDDKVRDYIIDLVQASRDPAHYGMDDIAPLIEFGASPRATIYLAVAARAHAFLRHRGFVIPEDIKAIGQDVLRHRVILTYEAEADEIAAEDIVLRLFEGIEVP